MKMKKVEIGKLVGDALSWAVASCNGEDFVYRKPCGGEYGGFEFERRNYAYDIKIAGPLMDCERISTQVLGEDWAATSPGKHPICHIHKSRIVAAMRVFVQMRTGAKIIEVPSEYL